ncbi:unnamed protein product [Paramecium octaurelia]|uniref:WD-40 repeat protein n=1 Tax=Paramecium octaurelia TaxID=43137 RepID=A0A8S1V2Z2_PAROT|nr:unnamed protein product [Paramecium octaurelia]
MNCTYHTDNQVSMICIAPHKCQCQRKLCVECQFNHGVDVKHAVPIKIFQEMVKKKLREYNLDETSEITKQKNNFKLMFSQTQSMMKKIWEQLSESFKHIYNLIEKKNKSYSNLINENTNLAETSFSDLEQIVSILEGKILDDWKDEKKSYLIKLQEEQHQFEQDLNSFVEKLKRKIIIPIQNITQDLISVYERKEDLYEILAQTKKYDELFLNEIIELLKKEKVTDCFQYLSSKRNKYQPGYNFIICLIKNISEIDFNKQNYSAFNYEQIRKDLIKKIDQDKHIRNFLKFLVQLTAIDQRFIKCGSNSLNLLVELKVNLREQSFENIRIKIPLQCNFNGSEFDNVDISGMNLNQASLFDCKWRNVQIHGLSKLDGHSNYVSSVCFSPDGYTLASGSYDHSIGLWDLKTGQQQAKLNGHSHYVMSVYFSPDGTTLASGSEDESIRLWDVKTGQQKLELKGHDATVWSVCFSPDGTTLASGSSDNSIRLWDVQTGQQKAKLDGHSHYVRSICFSPDGITLASGSSDKSIRLWDIKTEQQKAKLDGHSHYVMSVCFSPDGTTLASGSSDNSIRLWNVITGYQKLKLEAHDAMFGQFVFLLMTGQQKLELTVHDATVWSICFSPDGTTLASGSSDKSIRLFDVNTKQQEVKLDGHINLVYFFPDGITLASRSSDNSIRLWNVKTAKEILPQDNFYKDLLSQFKWPIQTTSILKNDEIDHTILRICQNPILEAKGALILKGEFVNDQGQDLKLLLKSKGSCILESQTQFQKQQH